MITFTNKYINNSTVLIMKDNIKQKEKEFDKRHEEYSHICMTYFDKYVILDSLYKKKLEIYTNEMKKTVAHIGCLNMIDILEHSSGKFIIYERSIDPVDMVICFKDDKRFGVPIIELERWPKKPIRRDIDKYAEDLDFYIYSYWCLFSNELECLRFAEYDGDIRRKFICMVYDSLKYIESYRSKDNEDQEIKKFLISDYRSRILFDTFAVSNIIKKGFIEGIIDIEFFVDKYILLKSICEYITVYE